MQILVNVYNENGEIGYGIEIAANSYYQAKEIAMREIAKFFNIPESDRLDFVDWEISPKFPMFGKPFAMSDRNVYYNS